MFSITNNMFWANEDIILATNKMFLTVGGNNFSINKNILLTVKKFLTTNKMFSTTK
jgi:hypothetical protein